MLCLIKLLTRIFVKNSDDVKNPDVRSAYGNMSGIVGIFLNLCLFAAKLTTGVFSSSISVISDPVEKILSASAITISSTGIHSTYNSRLHHFHALLLPESIFNYTKNNLRFLPESALETICSTSKSIHAILGKLANITFQNNPLHTMLVFI